MNSQSAEVCAEISESESKKTPWESILDDLQNKEANALQVSAIMQYYFFVLNIQFVVLIIRTYILLNRDKIIKDWCKHFAHSLQE